MTKSELKTGMVVTLKNGDQYRVYRNAVTSGRKEDGIFVNNSCGWDLFKNYNDDLTAKYDRDYDIMKVELVDHPYDFVKDLKDVKITETLWERKEPKELTVAEISRLLGYEVKIIK